MCFRIEQYEQSDNYHNRSGYSDLSGHENVGEMCLRSRSYSMVIIVTTGVGTTCHWNPLEEALKTAWGQQNKASAGDGAGRLPSRRTAVDKSW